MTLSSPASPTSWWWLPEEEEDGRTTTTGTPRGGGRMNGTRFVIRRFFCPHSSSPRRPSSPLLVPFIIVIILLSSTTAATTIVAFVDVLDLIPGSADGRRRRSRWRTHRTASPPPPFAAPPSSPTSSSSRRALFVQSEKISEKTTNGAGSSANDRNSIVCQLRSLSSAISRNRGGERREAGGGRRRRRGADASGSSTLRVRRALLRTLSLRSPAISPDRDGGTDAALRGALTDACIRAIRASGDEDDYVYVGKLLDAAVSFSESSLRIIDDGGAPEDSSREMRGVLEPRIFGEAIDALSRTSAGPAKIRRAWRLLLECSGGDGGIVILAAPPGAHELNAYIRALASRGKIRAALDAYYAHATDVGDGADEDVNALAIEADGYTYSALLNALTDTVVDVDVPADREGGGGGGRNERKEGGGRSRRHWQWEEALTLLDSAAATEGRRLNNHVYSAALKLNDRLASAVTTSRTPYSSSSSGRDGGHDGADEALAMLRRMQRDGVSPNVVTCTMVLSACDRGRRWREATALLGLMSKKRQGGRDWERMDERGGDEAFVNDDDGEEEESGGGSGGDDDDARRWTLPPPNARSYAAAASACARCNRVGEAMSILGDAANDGCVSTYVYNSAMSALVGSDVPPTARIRAVLGLLDRMMERHSSDDDSSGSWGSAVVAPNTVTYNTALAALTMTGSSSAMAGGAEAESDYSHVDAGGPRSTTAAASMEAAVVVELLGRMSRDGIPADSVTYRNAILACGRDDVDAAMGILETALDELPLRGGDDRRLREVCNAALSVCAGRGRMKKGDSSGGRRRAVRIFRDMIRKDIGPDSTTLFHMIRSLGSNSDGCLAATMFLDALRGRTDADDFIREKFDVDIHTIMGDKGGLRLLEERHYVAAMTSCLRSNKPDTVRAAISILGDMRDDGISPTQSTYKSVIYACCASATDVAGVEHRLALRRGRRLREEVEDAFGAGATPKKERSHGTVPSSPSKAAPRARAAVTLLGAVTDPDPSLLSAVSRACAASDMWADALGILRGLHGSAIAIGGIDVDDTDTGPSSRNRHVMNALPKLHRSLLSICARGGNVTAALAVADEVQRLEGELTYRSVNNTDTSSATSGREVDMQPYLLSLLSFGGDVDARNSTHATTDVAHTLTESSQLEKMIATQSTSTTVGVGMGAEEWKLVMIASSKARDWRVCLGTLQFLRPFVEETHPTAGFNLDRTVDEAGVAGGGVDRGTLGQAMHLDSSEGANRRRHANLSDALTSALLCLEACGHYAWAIRAIYDWIEWSGRRPGRQAVVAASRVLAARGQGKRVADLVSRAIAVNNHGATGADDCDGVDHVHLAEDVVYERDLYGQSITALYKSGDYKSADELYATAVEAGYLPWAVVQDDERGVVQRETASDRETRGSRITPSGPVEHETLHRTSDENEPLILDLHGMTTAIAHSAVRTALWKEIQLSEQQPRQVTDEIEGARDWTRDIIIVTGRGMNSAERLRPVLRPEVQRMLLEEFYPPLSTASISGNMGALRVPAADVNAWLSFHREQRGMRMLILADLLRKISSGSQLKRGIAKLAGSKR